MSNVNAARGNSIGDRHADFMRVVAHLKSLPSGMHDASTLPPELQIKNLICVYVDSRKAYALEFPSHPIDSNPIFVYVEESVTDPEALIHAFVADHIQWRFARKLNEPGWFYVHGP